MTNKPHGVLYIGCTDDLFARVVEHKQKLYRRAFTARYNCNSLVYFEDYHSGKEASARESQLKKWNRDWKIQLIEGKNPSWMDIAMNWNESSTQSFKSKRVKGMIQLLDDCKGKMNY